MRFLITVITGLVCACAAAAQTPDELHKMLDAKQNFAMRDAVEHAHSSVPVFYRGAVEASLNQIAPARKHLERAIRNDPHSKEASDALGMLISMATRNGHYREALRWLQDAHIATPNSEDLNNWLPAFRAFAKAGDMKVVHLKSSSVDCNDGLRVLINSKAVTYWFDTGGLYSVMGESDAKMLGLRWTHVETKGGEASGTAIQGFDVAIAKDFVTSGLHLRNVVFIVLQDSNEPFAHLPVGQRGMIGLPVLIAMRAIRADRAGQCEFGPGVRANGPGLRNLLFDGGTPIVQANVDGKPLTFSLDTGAADTDLNEGFANALPDLVKAGQKESRAITGYGGSNTYDSVLMGPVVFSVGGMDVTLKSPHVFPHHSLGSFDGNLGDDILNQAKTVTLDFNAMELRLE
jgi:hypothetical protein